MGIPLHNGGQGSHLAVVHHAHDDVHFLAVVHALGRKHRCRMVELGDDLFGYLLGVVGDDLKAHSAAAIFQKTLRHGGGGEGIEDAQQHRLHLVVIDKIAGDGHHGVHNETQAVDALLRVLAVQDGGHKIRAAGIGAGLHQNGVHIPHDDAGGQRSQNPTGAGLGGIGNGGHIHPVQNQKAHGKHHHIDHAPHGNGLADLTIDDQCQRDIDQQAHIAYADAADLLDNGADAVQSRRGEGIGKDEQFIVQRRQHGHGDDHKIGPDPFHIPHFFRS